ncbi:MAG: hypothetical protein KJO23_06580 [Bacteroidia bacterium]|nr:hypothetical protein [Bacteroidia bacterium]
MPRPSDCITRTEAENLQGNWMNNQAKDLKSVTGVNDTCAVTFDIDQLTEYLAYVKSEAATKGFDTPGIRVYFAAQNTAAAGRATLFFCAAEGDGGNTKNIYSIDPLNKGNNGWPPNAY